MADIIRGLFPQTPQTNEESAELRDLAVKMAQTGKTLGSETPHTPFTYLATVRPYTPFTNDADRTPRADFFEQTRHEILASEDGSLILQPGEYYDFVDVSQDNPIADLLGRSEDEGSTLSDSYSYPQMDIKDTYDELQLERDYLSQSYTKIVDIGSVYSGEN